MRWFGKYAVSAARRPLRDLAGLAVICVALTLAGCKPAGEVDEWAGVVAPSVLESASLKYYWRFKIDLDDGETIRQIWRLDGNLYALTSAHQLIALDAARGLYKWSHPVGSQAQKIFAPCHADGVLVPETGGIAVLLDPPLESLLKPFNAVIINTLSYALLINRDTGKLVRKLDFDFAANTPGACDGVHFYVASAKGWYHAVRLAEGLRKWTMSTADIITARPRVFNRRLYVASQDGKFYAINPADEQDRHLWTQLTDAPLSAGFVAERRGCFVPSQDCRLYVYDNLTGVELWKFTAQGPLRQAVQVGRETVFQFADRDRFYAIALANGRKRWDSPDGRIVLAAAKPYVFVLTAGRRLLLVHEMLGKVHKSLPMTGLDLFIPNAAKSVIYAATTDGKFVCIRPISAGHLTPKVLKD